jgi:alpha-L-rhamnosidase
MRNYLVFAALLASSFALRSQSPPPPDEPHRTWRAAWVTHPAAPLREPLVLHFRRTVDLSMTPASYPVRVSADNRFILYVNGRRVGEGPARGDLAHWRYERFDLAPFLKAGKNLITATVWNFGIFAPIAQISDRTTFLLESDATGDSSISTPTGWLVEEEPGQIPLDRKSVNLLTYFASGPGEQIDASRYEWDWDSPSATGPAWVPVASPMRDSIFPVNTAHSADTTGDNPWGLIPDTLPPMEYSPTTAGHVVRTDLAELNSFPEAAVIVSAGQHLHILLDRKTLTTAYPQLIVSGGKGAKIRLTYSEALYDKDQKKGDRDDVDERVARGLSDSFLPDGGPHRVFEPLWWRTWRYLDLDIQTADEPIQLESLKAWFTAYPFEERASFRSGDPDLDKIWEISWRTARLDAHETYMDTPYYEQLQYIGDTRIQALISYSVAGDDRLARQALMAFDESRFPEGLTRSRYPSSLPQTIPTFSLLYIGMLRDYWLYRSDRAFVGSLLPGTRSVLDWFASHQQSGGLLDKLPWWSFIDWVSSGETPTYDAHNESCITTLEYLGALEDATDLEHSIGDPILAARYQARAKQVRSGIYSKCWAQDRGLIADNPDRKVFSQQANILAVLYDVIPKDGQQPVLRKILSIEPGSTPDGVLSASYYFRFYLARALDHAGMADDYLRSLDPWRKLLPLHFSTWPEIPGDTRSDSHAWSAHPIYDLLTLVVGIQPATPAFATVRVAPHLGNLSSITASYPHPAGSITVEYRRGPDGLDATITLPEKLTGNFVYGGRQWPLKPGQNHIQAPWAK